MGRHTNRPQTPSCDQIRRGTTLTGPCPRPASPCAIAIAIAIAIAMAMAMAMALVIAGSMSCHITTATRVVDTTSWQSGMKRFRFYTPSLHLENNGPPDLAGTY